MQTLDDVILCVVKLLLVNETKIWLHLELIQTLGFGKCTHVTKPLNVFMIMTTPKFEPTRKILILVN